MHASNPSTQEAKTGGSRVQGQPGMDMETLSKSKNVTIST
jgi:hypothetical protein